MTETQDLVGADFEQMVEYCCAMAEEYLQRFGEFTPFAVYIDANDALTPVAFYRHGEPFTQQLLDHLLEKFETDMTGKRAYAIVFDTTITNQQFSEPAPAVAIKLVHSGSKEKFIYYFPYQSKDERISFLPSWGEYLP